MNNILINQPINLCDINILKCTAIACNDYLAGRIVYLILADDTELYPGAYTYLERFNDDEWHNDLESISKDEAEEYSNLIFQDDIFIDYDYNSRDKQEITWFDMTRLTESDYLEIKERTEKLLAFTISLLDKYTNNQMGDLNLRFILMQYQTINSIENKLELTTEEKGELYTRLFNPNIFNAVNLLGILAGNERLEYLEYYKQANWIELIKFIEKLYDKYQTRIEVLIPVLEDNLPVDQSRVSGWDKVYYVLDTDPAYNYSRALKQYLIIFDLLVIRLKHNYDSKTRDSTDSNETNSFTLSDLVLILSSKTLIEALNLSTSQLSQLEGFLLNLEFDGEQLDNGIIFDNERWQFIYHWIDQMRTWLVKNG